MLHGTEALPIIQFAVVHSIEASRHPEPTRPRSVATVSEEAISQVAGSGEAVSKAGEAIPTRPTRKDNEPANAPDGRPRL